MTDKTKKRIRVAGDKDFTRRHFGLIAIDSGLLWVGSWRDSDTRNGESTATNRSRARDQLYQFEGTGVTLNVDSGEYPVTAEIDENGRVMSVTVDLSGYDEFEDDDPALKVA